MTVTGEGAWLRSAASDSTLLTARFVVDLFGPHLTSAFDLTDQHPIIWDPTPDWDDIGFPSDYWEFGGGFFPPDNGDYLITASIEMGPDTAWTTGRIEMGINSGSSAVNSWTSTLATTAFGTNPQLMGSTMYRIVGGSGSFDVNAYTWDTDDTSTLVKASITITKLNSATS